MKKAILLILDGFGYSKNKEHNAVLQAQAPYIKSLFNDYNYSLLDASGESVGLPSGVMGNSEVGHITIGAGRIIYQDLSRINKYIQEVGLSQHKDLLKTLSFNRVHLIVLVSDGGVHSHIDHLLELINFYKANHKEACVHIISDGRDTPPKSVEKYVNQVEEACKDSTVCITSICGRFYAMDRDKRWDRIEAAYHNLIKTEKDFDTVEQAIASSYKEGQTDEFILPKKISEIGIDSDDAVVFFNFRSDRARELTSAFTDLNFKNFDCSVKLAADQWFTFSKYSEDFDNPVLFPKESPKHIIGEVIQEEGLCQLRIAETEKYAHVTYFMNGGREEVFKGEERILVDSPKSVKTYDEKPEMSAYEVTERLVSEIKKNKFDFIACNYANGDMVGHTGNEAAAIAAVEALDKCLAKVVPEALSQGYEIFLTADHGNCEEMVKNQGVSTQHSMNPVPFIHISTQSQSLSDGGLQDIAPTILSAMSIKIPKEMTGKVLFKQ